MKRSDGRYWLKINLPHFSDNAVAASVITITIVKKRTLRRTTYHKDLAGACKRGRKAATSEGGFFENMNDTD